VFGDRDSGAYLLRFAWTKIIRHDLIKGAASPDDPTLTRYWAKRRRTTQPEPPIERANLRVLARQRGRCPICGGLLLHADHQPASPQEWEQWLKATRKAITKQAITTIGNSPPDDPGTCLIHTSCRRREPPAAQHFCRPASPTRACLSRDAQKPGTSGSEGGPPQQCGGPT
jgi:RNA-directed DNA polymerase